MNSNIVVACVGGGQLGRMMAMESPRLNVSMYFLDPLGSECPAAQVVPSSSVVRGSLQDPEAVRKLVERAKENCNSSNAGGGKRVVVTVEIEHVNVDALAQVEQGGENENGTVVVEVLPSPRVLRIIQDKYLQKRYFAEQNNGSKKVALGPFRKTSCLKEIKLAIQELGLPIMLKRRRGGYDGRGNAVLRRADDESIEKALRELGITEYEQQEQEQDEQQSFDLYAEGWIDFVCEVAVMVVRSAPTTATSGEGDDGTATIASYPCANAVQQNSVCRVVLVPARNLSAKTRRRAERLAVRAVDSLGEGAVGAFGVEMFVVRRKSDKGGEDDDDDDDDNSNNDDDHRVLLNEIAPRPHNTGHYTQQACSVSQFENHLRAVCGMPLGSTRMIVEAAAMVNVLGRSSEATEGSTTMMDTTMRSSDAALRMEHAAVHWYGKSSCRPGRKMGHINLVGHSHGELDPDLYKLLELEGIPFDLLPAANNGAAAATASTPAATPLVGIVMGSQSDLPTMNAAVDIMKKFGVPYEVDVVSAHRTPDKLVSYSRNAAGRGLRVIIAGAGGAAHLPGMVASMTPLPVVGVPVKTSTLSGVDSLYSIVQMPRGIPVAAVAIGNATNAGLLAVRILSTSRPELRAKMRRYQDELKDTVDEMSAKLLDLGSDAFLEQMDNKNESVNV